VTVTVTNLIQGPATLYYGASYTGAYSTSAEPADAAVNTTPASSAWTDMGGTQGGVNLEVNREFAELEVDQLVDVPDRRLTKREMVITTNLAEVTLENLALLANDSPPVTGSGIKTFEPTFSTSATQPNYRAIILDGYAPQQYRRRVIGRRMLSTASITVAYQKDGQTVYQASWNGHYVSASIAPWKIIDQTS
jgi:hypothetical protein